MPLRILPAGAMPVDAHHTFEEATLEDVADSMDAMAEVGNVDFALELSFANSGNRVTRVDLTMRLTLAMPVWTEVGNRPQAEQNEWNRFLRALRVHENGHLAICRREAPVAYRRLRKAKADTINDVLSAEETRIQRLNDAYDHRTDHGRTQRTRHGTTVIQLPP